MADWTKYGSQFSSCAAKRSHNLVAALAPVPGRGSSPTEIDHDGKRFVGRWAPRFGKQRVTTAAAIARAARGRSPFGASAWAAANESSSGLAVIFWQKLRSFVAPPRHRMPRNQRHPCSFNDYSKTANGTAASRQFVSKAIQLSSRVAFWRCRSRGGLLDAELHAAPPTGTTAETVRHARCGLDASGSLLDQALRFQRLLHLGAGAHAVHIGLEGRPLAEVHVNAAGPS
jgi:hypothetical protein